MVKHNMGTTRCGWMLRHGQNNGQMEKKRTRRNYYINENIKQKLKAFTKNE